MTYKERRAILHQKPFVRVLWFLTLLLIALPIVLVLYQLSKGFNETDALGAIFVFPILIFGGTMLWLVYSLRWWAFLSLAGLFWFFSMFDPIRTIVIIYTAAIVVCYLIVMMVVRSSAVRK